MKAAAVILILAALILGSGVAFADHGGVHGPDHYREPTPVPRPQAVLVGDINRDGVVSFVEVVHACYRIETRAQAWYCYYVVHNYLRQWR